MGFSIKSFFEELDEIMADKNLDEQDMLSTLEDAIIRNKKYADECGHL